jgi:type IV pilus assembly protein PilV
MHVKPSGSHPGHSAQRGFSMLEILGLLGFLGLQARAQVAEMEAYQRGQALILVQDMVDRLSTNRKAAGCYDSKTVGTGAATPTCTATVGTTATRATATEDLDDWHNALLGTSETLGGASVGAIIGARGCISSGAAFNGATPYRVAVAWQGLVETVAPTNIDAVATCGLNQYGSEARRREVSTTVYIADLD